MNLARTFPDLSAGLSELGRDFTVSERLHLECEKFVCFLYRKTSTVEVNELRHQLFVSKASQSDQMPPTRDALRQHILRCNYQAAIWQRALQSEPDIPNPIGHGWSLNDEQLLTIQWTTKQPAPDELLLLIACNCRTGCSSGRCSCLRSGFHCTAACGCTDCANTDQSQSRGGDLSSGDDTDDDDDGGGGAEGDGGGGNNSGAGHGADGDDSAADDDDSGADGDDSGADGDGSGADGDGSGADGADSGAEGDDSDVDGDDSGAEGDDSGADSDGGDDDNVGGCGNGAAYFQFLDDQAVSD